MKRLRKVSIFAALMLLMGLFLLSIPLTLSSIRPGISIKQEHLDSLQVLEEMAVQKGDYPIGALIIYKGKIIGAGYNTIRNLNEPTGHAEINALKDVFGSVDNSDFKNLQRDSLILITSLEPCSMCKGTINHYDIRQIYYVNQKKIRYRLKYLRQDISFYLKTRRINAPEDQ